MSEVRPAGRTVVVANPMAGRGKGGKLIGKAAEILHQLGVEHQIQVSESAVDLEAKARAAAEGGAAIVAVLGGDGSVSAAANGVLGTGATLAVFPGGTGDDFAKAIGAGKFEPAVKLLANPKSQAIDVVRLTTGPSVRHFVNVAGAGFDSEVNETANAMKIDLGSAGTYVAAVFKTLSKFTPAHYEIVIDDRALSLDAMLAIVGSGISYGGGMKVLPSASLIDGLLDVCIVEALSKDGLSQSVPEGVQRLAHHTPQDPDVPVQEDHDGGQSPHERSRRRRADRPASGDLRSAAGGAARGDRTWSQGHPMTDGLVLIHAFPVDAGMWQGQVSAFAGRLPVVAPNLPGFGGTEGSGDVMTMSLAAERCIQTMDDAGLDRAVVCGLSMGGYVALDLWRAAPQRICGLILANTRSGADGPEAAEARRTLAARLRQEGSAFLVESPPPLLSQDAPADLRDRVRALIAAQPAGSIAAAALGMAQRPDSTPDLARHRRPDPGHNVLERQADPARGERRRWPSRSRARSSRHRRRRRSPVEPGGATALRRTGRGTHLSDVASRRVVPRASPYDSGRDLSQRLRRSHSPSSWTTSNWTAIDAIDRGSSVLVAAPTGSGKTVVAEYAIERALSGGGKAFYTTPLKALSNQKFGDLVQLYGADRVGLLTGDNTINSEAPVVVMTTEVLRNMLYERSGTARGP